MTAGARPAAFGFVPAQSRIALRVLKPFMAESALVDVNRSCSAGRSGPCGKPRRCDAWRMCRRGSGDRTRWRQFNRVPRCECLLRRMRAANPINTICAVKLIVGTDRVEYNVSGLCAPQRVWLDDPHSASPLLVHIIKLNAQAIGRRKADNFKRRTGSHAMHRERARRRANHDVARC